MSNVIQIDNFGHIRGLPQNKTWLSLVYTLGGNFTSTSYAEVTEIEGKSALTLTGRSANTAHWLVGYPLPNEQTTFVLGFRVIGTPAASRGTASFGIVANLDTDGYDLIFGIELTPSGAILHYQSPTGPTTVDIPFAYGTTDTYIDVSFVKSSMEANSMSRLTLMANNFPAYSGEAFNNVGSNLTAVLGGVLPVEPDLSSAPGYLRHSYFDNLYETNLGYSITDMYIARNGHRFGNPVVDNASLVNLDSSLISNDESKTVAEVLTEGPNEWTFAQGSGTSEATFDTNASDASQVRVYAQTQIGTEHFSLEYGSETVQAEVGVAPKALTITTDSDAALATLEIGNE